MRLLRERRRRAAALLATAALLTVPSVAGGQTTVSSAGHAPIELRTAIALGGPRTTVWTQVHATTEAGAFALVVPAATGAGLDLATDAWLEALEAATARRVLPPSGVDAVCPEDGGSDPVHVVGDLEHRATLVPAETDVLAGAGEVLLWAAERDLVVSPEVAQALADSEATHFVALRFAAPEGEAWTPTLRVALPTAEATLPLALVQASDVELDVTVFALAAGRVSLPGELVAIDPSRLEFDADSATSDYRGARASALDDAGAWLVEAAGHGALVASVALAGEQAIPAVVAEYFARADAYGAATDDPDACTSLVVGVLGEPAVLGAACPRADLGVVGGGPACVEAPAGGEVDPVLLRCGGDADDLALAFSGLAGEDAWLTRIAARIAPGQVGLDRAVSAGEGEEVTPVLQAGSVDLSGCGQGGGSGEGGAGASTTASSTTGGSGSGPTTSVGSGPLPGASAGGGVVYVEVPVRVYDVTCGCSGEYVIVDYLDVPEEEVPEDGSYYAEGEDGGCSGDTAESYETSEVDEEPTDEDCEGDTRETSSDDGCEGETSETAESSGDGCSGDTSDSADDGDDDGDDDGGSSDDGGDDGGSSDGSDGSEGDSGCGCDESAVAAAATRATKRPSVRRVLRARPKLSVLALGLIALLAPLRRITRPRRT